MINKNNFSKLLLLLLIITYISIVRASDELTDLPDCSSATIGSSKCDNTFKEKTYCKKGNQILISTENSCKSFTLNSENYYLFECDDNSCDLAYDGVGEIIYYYNENKLTKVEEDEYSEFSYSGANLILKTGNKITANGDISGVKSVDDLKNKYDIYKCNSGICSKNKGYAIVATNVYKYEKTSNPKWSTYTQATSCGESDRGNFKIDGNTLNLCITGTSFTSVEEAKYFILSNKKIISVTNDDNYLAKVITEEDAVAGNYLVNSLYEIIDYADSDYYEDATDLIVCLGNSCTKTPENEVSYGYYAKALNPNELYFCDGMTCDMKDEGEYYDDKLNYYVDTDGNLHLCTDESCPLVENPDGYYIDTGTVGNIISCDKNAASSKCKSFTGISGKGYAYIDASETGTTSNKKFITCKGDGTACTVLDQSANLVTSTNKIYLLDPANPKQYIECVGKGSAQNQVAAECTIKNTSGLQTNVAFFADGTSEGYTITCVKDGGCFSSKGLQQCGSVTSSSSCKKTDNNQIAANSYCIYTDGKIYTTDNSKCTAITDPGVYFFKNDNTKIDGNGEGGKYVYNCDSDGCTQYVNSSYLDPKTSYLYVCTDGECTKTNSGITAGIYYLSGFPTLSTTRPYWVYKSLINCSGTDVASCSDVTNLTKVGYYDNSNNEYILKRRGTDGTNIFGKLDAKPTDKCSASNVGMLGLKSDGNVAICLGKTLDKAEAFAATGEKLLEYGVNNVFGMKSGQKILVDIKVKSITLKVDLPKCTVSNGECTQPDGSKLKQYKYCIGKSDSKIYKGLEDNKCEIVKVTQKDEGFKIFNVKNVLEPTLVTTETLNDPYLAIYHCAYGECKRTSGFIQNNGKVYLSAEDDTTDITTLAASTKCEDHNDQGNIKYTVSGNVKTFQVCVLDHIEISGKKGDTQATTETKSKWVNVVAGNNYVLRPYTFDDPVPTNVAFANDPYSNIALLRTEANVVALAKHSPQLPLCDNKCKVCEDEDCTSKSYIETDGFCLYNDGTTILKYESSGGCKKMFGKDATGAAATGIKIFQRTSSFNKFVDVTSTLDNVSPNNAEELTPFFVIYDCSDEKCLQSSGFIKYGSNNEFVNCYMGNNINANDNSLEPLSNPIGCIRLNEDKSHDDLCSGSTSSTPEQVKNAINLAATGSYKFDGETFRMCINVVDEDENTYEYLYDNTKLISIPFGEEGQVFFKNGETPFPNTLKDGKVLIRFNKNYAVLARNIKPGYYYNFATVYDGEGKGKAPGYDALIYCDEDDLDYYYENDEGTGESALSECYIDDFGIGEYYNTDITHFLDTFSKRVITCKYDGCHLQRKTVKGYFLNDNDFEDDIKPVIQCNGTLCEEIEDKQDGKLKEKHPGIAYIDSLSDGYGYGDNIVYICYDSTCGTDRIEIQKISDGTAIYKSIKGVPVNKFPGVAAGGKITLKISDGAAVLMENDSLTACSETISASSPCFNGAREGQYCWHATSKKIYETSNGGCTVKTVDEDGQLLFFDTKGKALSELTETRTDVLAYHCTPTECGLFKGYAIMGGKTIHCNGWKDEGCEIVDTSGSDCAPEDTGNYVSTDSKLCFTDGAALSGDTSRTVTSRTVPLPTDDNVKTIAFSAPEANNYYGAAIEDIVFLSISKDLVKVIAAPKPITDSYYFNQFAGINHSNVLIKCNSSGCSQANFHNDPVAEGQGLNANTIIDSGDPKKKSLIYQFKGRYEYHDITSDLKNESKLSFVSQLESTKVIICTDADGCTVEIGSVIPGHAYIDNKATGPLNKYVITCGAQKCTPILIEAQEGKPLFYIDGKETNKVIKVSNDHGCELKEGSTTNAHAYVYEDASGDTKSIITCNSTGCTVTTFTTTDLSSDKKFIYGDDIKYLITCTASGCAKDSNEGNGSFEDGSDSNRTITCVSGKGCISSAAISSGCESAITDKDSPCKDSNNSNIDSGYYCYSSGGIIYESTEDGKCESKTEDVLIEKEGKKYKAAEWGISSIGIIYVKNESKYEQVISSFHLYENGEEKYLYKCDDSGNCMIVNKISVGYYLSGIPEVGTELTYTQLIQCTDTIATSCSKINDLSGGYYVDAGNLNNVIKCSESESNNEVIICSTKESNKKQGVAYLDNSGIDGEGNTKSYITCNEEKCESITTNLTESEELYFIDGSDDNIQKLIKCNSDRCVSESGGNDKKLDGTDKNYTITCNVTGGKPCVSEKECRVNTGANCENNKYYNVKATDYILEKGSNDGTLYYCKEDTEKESGFSCFKLDSPGYYINSKDEIYECGTSGQCTVNSLSDKCSEANIGKLYIDGNGKLNLCVNYSNGKAYPVLIDFNASGNYLIQYKAGNIFGIQNGENAIVKVDGNSVALNKNFKFTKNNYVYVNKETFAVLNNNQCPPHQNMSLTDVVEEYEKCSNNYIKKSCQT